MRLATLPTRAWCLIAYSFRRVLAGATFLQGVEDFEEVEEVEEVQEVERVCEERPSISTTVMSIPDTVSTARARFLTRGNPRGDAARTGVDGSERQPDDGIVNLGGANRLTIAVRPVAKRSEQFLSLPRRALSSIV